MNIAYERIFIMAVCIAVYLLMIWPADVPKNVEYQHNFPQGGYK